MVTIIDNLVLPTLRKLPPESVELLIITPTNAEGEALALLQAELARVLASGGQCIIAKSLADAFLLL